jgi:uncharacterized protein (TIGR02145 family)
MSRPQNARNSVPAITNNQRGRVSLTLPGQNYKTTEISLYSVSGRQILRTSASATEAARSISRPNLVPGVYLLKVKGANEHSFTNRLTHRGGSLNIDVTFGNENLTPASATTALSKQAPVSTHEDWIITVSAPESKHNDTLYTLGVVKGMNLLQDITLKNVSDSTKADSSKGDAKCSKGDHFNPSITYGCFTDPRDEQSYRTVQIGTQTWMAENLNFNTTWSLCANNCKYGHLYTWAGVMGFPDHCNMFYCADQILPAHQGICPPGWHVPSVEEWTTLVDYAGGESTAGTKLKSATGWNSGNGTDDFGFSALPAGFGQGIDSDGITGYTGNWWTASIIEGDQMAAWYLFMFSGDYSEVFTDLDSKGYRYSLRCIRD